MKLKKGLSLALSLVLVAQMCLPAMANSPVDSGVGEIVCTHHADHTAECGYAAGTPCTHAHTAECGADGESCGHAHDAECGYTAGTPCTFNPATCPECNSVPAEPVVPEKPVEPTAPEKPEVPVKPEAPMEPLAPALGVPKVANAVTIDISNPYSYIVIEKDGYTVGNGAKVDYTGDYVLSGNTTLTTSQFDHIYVNNGGSTPIKITLRDMSVLLISGATDEKCAFAIGNGEVELTLEGSNSLQSGSNKAGIQLTKTASLTITKESTGSLNVEGGSDCAGIGGEGAITISGGVVTAQGDSLGNGIGDGASGGKGSTFSTGAGGNAVIFANSISDQSNKKNWSGMIFENNRGAIYGDSFTLSSDITIPEGHFLHIGYGQILTIPAGINLTNKGNIIVQSGSINGTVIDKQPIIEHPSEFNISSQLVITDTGYKIGNAQTETPYKGPYVLTGNATSTNALTGNHISVQNSVSGKPIAITLKNVDIQFYNEKKCPFSIDKGSVNLTLEGKNVLRGGDIAPGLRVEEGKSLTITAESNGSLTATGGHLGSGIGSGEPKIKGGVITINGGVVTATGGSIQATGIGGGYNDMDGGSFSALGSAVIIANSIRDQNGKGNWSGIFFEDSTEGVIRGSGHITLTGNITIPNGYILQMKEGQSITVPEGKTLTVEGYICKNGGTVNDLGNIVYPGNILPMKPTDISKADIWIGIGGSSECNPCKGHVITGTSDQHSIIVLKGTHNIMLVDADITGKTISPFALSGTTVNLTLVGTNTLKGPANFAGLSVHKGNTLNITAESTGKLNATGGYYGAGIGGDYNNDAGKPNQPGTININGGTVNATGGYDSAGIGGGYCGAGGNITINGGTVKATGGYYGAGIGGGYHGAGGNITINGGDVTAKGDVEGAGIGGGSEGMQESRINISGGKVNATGGSGGSGGGAGIGGGKSGSMSATYISGGNITANGGSGGSGIGGGKGGGAKTSVTIVGGTVHAVGGAQGAGIGQCLGESLAPGNNYGIDIRGGTVYAEGGNMAAGIGGTYGLTFNNITISGGTVTAIGGGSAAGIGGGYKSAAGYITIDGDAVVFATKGANAPNYIGCGVIGQAADVKCEQGIIFEGYSGKLYGSVTLNENATLSSGKNLTIPVGKSLTVSKDITLTNNATLLLDGGTINGKGKIDGSGTFKASISAEDIGDIPDQIYTGKAVEPPVTVSPTRTILGENFTVVTEGYTKGYQNNTNVGTAKVQFTKSKYPTAEKSFNIVKSDTAFEGGVKAYNGTKEATRFTYGETITVKATPKATGTVANVLALAEPTANQMALYLGNTQISEPVGADNNGVYTMEYKTTDKVLPPAYSTITAKYVGTGSMAAASDDISVTLLPKALTAETSIGELRMYNGGTDFVDAKLTLAGILGSDVVTATATGKLDGADKGIHAVTASSTTLGGANANYYTLDPAVVSGNLTIFPKPVTINMTAANKVYDGTAAADAAYAVVGTVGTDYLTASGTAVFDSPTVAGTIVTATDIKIDKDIDNKYLNYTNFTLTATAKAKITPKPLTWSTDGTVNNKEYNGNKATTVATAPRLIGILSNDEATMKNGTVEFASANAGTHTITASGFGVEGNDSRNYRAPAGQPVFANGTITAKNVKEPTVTVTGKHTFTGSQIKPIVTVTDGNKSLDASDYTVTYGENVNAGTGSVTVKLQGNYSGSKTQTFPIGKATRSDVTTNPILMTAGAEKQYSIPLPAISNAGTVVYSAGTPIGDPIFKTGGVPKVDQTNKTLDFTSANVSTGTATVGITVESQNYENFIVTQPFEVSGKTTVEITGLTAAEKLIYNGKPQSGYKGTISVEGGNVLATDLVYTYSGISGTQYNPTTNLPTNAGNYMLTIEVNKNNASYTGRHAVITFAIGKAPITVAKGSYIVTKTWNGSTTPGSGSGELSVIGRIPSGVTITAIPREYPSSNVSSNHTVTVDLALTGTGSGNYVLNNSTVEVPGIITNGAAPVAGKPSATPISMSDTAITLQPVVVVGETVEYAKSSTTITPKTGWQDSTIFSKLEPGTTYYFFARVKKTLNHDAGIPSAGTAITTDKISSPLIAPKGMTFPVGSVWNADFSVQDLLGEWKYYTGSDLPKDAKFSGFTGPVGNNRKVLESIEINDTTNKLIFTSKNNATVPDGEDVFNITVSFDKYQDVTFPLTFRNSEKLIATISAKLESKIYDGNAMVQPIPTATSGGSPIKALEYTYQWQNGDGTNIDTAPENVGTYALVIKGENSGSVGSLTIQFMIVKRPLTVTANDEKIKAGADIPQYSYTVKGLVSSDSLTGITLTCDYRKDGSVASSNAGRYPITVSGDTEGNSNYAITYVPGTLTVTLDTTALDNAITAAKAAKSGVSTSDQEPSQVTKGTSFVTSAAMAALNAALDGAEKSKAGATTNGQISAAVAALTQATTTFKAAIKTGTNSSGGGGGGWEPTPQKHPADKFTDIKGHWAEENIRFVVEKNLFNGISDTLFAPDMTMTRGMLVTVLYRQAGSPMVEADKTTWYSTAREWAMKAGISDGTNMESTITRQELVTMLHRYAKHSGIDVSVGEDTNILSYNDAFDLPLWSIPAFQWACGADIVDGISGSLLPTETATRAQVSTMLKRFAALKAK